MGNQQAVGPPEEAEGAPPSQCIGAGIQVGGQPQTAGQTARCGAQSCSPSQHQSNSDSEREAQDPDALVVAATQCQTFGASVRPHADALGQNLLDRAISSAVEHLPYKEIVTGSIPVSPIKIQFRTGLWRLPRSADLGQNFRPWASRSWSLLTRHVPTSGLLVLGRKAALSTG